MRGGNRAAEMTGDARAGVSIARLVDPPGLCSTRQLQNMTITVR